MILIINQITFCPTLVGAVLGLRLVSRDMCFPCFGLIRGYSKVTLSDFDVTLIESPHIIAVRYKGTPNE